MKPLSKEASAALSALKATDPTAADEARVRKNLERALGVGIPAVTVAAATTAQAASVGAISVGAKAIVFVLAVGLSSVMTVKISSSLSSRGGEGRGEGVRTQPLSRPEQVVTPPKWVEVTQGPKAPEPVAPEPVVVVAAGAPPPAILPIAPTRTRPSQLVATIAPEPEAAPQPAAAQPVAPAVPALGEGFSAPPPPPPLTEATVDLEIEANFPNCDPTTELRSAVAARMLLDADRAEEAVWLLGAYQRRCPSGRWSDAAWTVRMAGLCRLKRNSEVIGLLQWFSTEYPQRRTAVMSELRHFCSEEVLKHGAGE